MCKCNGEQINKGSNWRCIIKLIYMCTNNFFSNLNLYKNQCHFFEIRYDFISIKTCLLVDFNTVCTSYQQVIIKKNSNVWEICLSKSANVFWQTCILKSKLYNGDSFCLIGSNMYIKSTSLKSALIWTPRI